MDWVMELIDRKAGKLKKQALQMHRAEVMTHNCEYLFRDLIGQLNQDRETWNRGNEQEDSVASIRTVGAFMFLRSGPNPYAVVTVARKGNNIDLEYSCALSYGSGNRGWNEHLTVTIDDNDLCVLSYREKPFPHLSAVSEFILEPILDPEKHFQLH